MLRRLAQRPTDTVTLLDPLFSRRLAQQLAIDLQVDLYSSGLTTTLARLERVLRDFSAFLHPHHGLLMTVKRSLMFCYSQAPEGSIGRREFETMRTIALEQLAVLDRVDPGYPDWRGAVLKHYSTAELFLSKLDLEAGAIRRPEFLLRVRKAAVMVQEGLRCTACIRLDRYGKFTKIRVLINTYNCRGA